MSIAATELREARVEHLTVTEHTLTVDLDDGRSISVPLAWYPRLLHATPEERAHWRLIGGREGIHWPDLDEDIRVAALVLGKLSGESQRSLKRWLESRQAHAPHASRRRFPTHTADENT